MSVHSEINTDLELVIENEKRELTRQVFAEVWDELQDENVNPEVIAEIFMDCALKALTAHCGDESASRMLEHFRQMDAMGGFADRGALQ